MLKNNRSAPRTAVIPVLYYPDVRAAAQWLTMVLPFTERLRIGDQMGYLLAAALGYGLVCSAVCFNSALAGVLLFLVALVW